MDINAALQLIVSSSSVTEAEDEKKALAAYLNNLLLNDFPALVQALYRVDVSEEKAKDALKENPAADAGDLLAELLVQRQQEKTVTRQASGEDNPSKEGAWEL